MRRYSGKAECCSMKARTRLHASADVSGELLLLPVEEAVRGAVVDDDLVLDGGRRERLLGLCTCSTGMPASAPPISPRTGLPSSLALAASGRVSRPILDPACCRSRSLLRGCDHLPRPARSGGRRSRNRTVKIARLPASRNHVAPAPASACMPAGVVCSTCGRYSKSSPRFETPAVRPK